MEKVSIYNDGNEQYVKISDLHLVILCGSNAFYTVYNEAKKGNFLKLSDCVKDELQRIGLNINYNEK